MKTKLSSIQNAIWLDQKINVQSSKYNIGGYAIINGRLDVLFFEEALNKVLSEHDVFGFRYEEVEDLPVCSKEEYMRLDAFECIEVSGESEALRKMTSDFQKPFSLNERRTPLKTCLFKLSPDKYIWYLKIHHIISDGNSFKLIFDQVGEYYPLCLAEKGMESGGRSFSYTNQIVKEEEYRNSPGFAADKAFWMKGYEHFPEFIFAGHSGHSGRSIKEFALTKNEKNNLQDLCREAEISVSNLLMVTISLALSKFYRQKTINLGVAILNRSGKSEKSTIGPFFNVLPLQIAVESDETIVQHSRTLKSALLACYRHRKFQQSDILKELRKKQYIDRLCDVIISYEDIDFNGTFAGMPSSIHALTSNQEETPITIHIMNFNEDELVFRFDINEKYIHSEEFDALLNSYEHLVKRVGDFLPKKVSEIGICYENQKDTVLEISSNKDDRADYKSFIATWSEVCRRNPESFALKFKQLKLTYREADDRSNQLAFQLKKLGVQKGDCVGVSIPRSENSILSIIALMKLGAIYVPIDPELPAQRKKFIARDCESKMVLIGDSLGATDFDKVCVIEDLLSETLGVNVFESAVLTESDIAYIIYTSGTTGNPKGVVIDHGAFINYVQTFSEYFKITAEDKFIQQASFSFDTSIEEIFPVLSAGGTLVIAENPKDFRALFSDCASHEITLISTGPYTLQYLNQNMAEFELKFKTIISGGDLLKPNHISNLVRKFQVYNTYGPTESTVCATYYKIEVLENPLPIGKPIKGRKVVLLDDDKNLLPKGATGEMFISGKGLAKGYKNLPEITNSSFLNLDGERYYKSGDLGKWSSKNELIFLGRADNQLSFRGYRIEKEEIENAIKQLDPTSKDCYVKVATLNSTPTLLAYIVSDLSADEIARLKLEIGQLIPGYMIPDLIINLERFPITSNGKIDFKRLPIPEEKTTRVNKFLARTTDEQMIAKIWSDLLRIPEIDIHTSFFELGGHSLLANKFVNSVRQNLNAEISLLNFYNHPTIAEIAQNLEVVENNKRHIVPAPEKELYPLAFSQERLWFLEQLNPGNFSYYVPRAIKLKGHYRHDFIEQTFTFLIWKHEILRTVFVMKDGIPYQKILPAKSFEVPLVSLQHLTKENQGSAVGDFILNEGNTPFDLVNGPLLRASILELSADENILVFCEHHLIHDGWTQGILLTEFIETYSKLHDGKELDKKRPELQFKDFASWQKSYFTSKVLDEQLDFWKKKLNGNKSVLNLPLDANRPSEISGNGELIVRELSPVISRKMVDFTSEQDMTLFVFMLTAFKLVLSKYSGDTDISVGSGVANRRLSETDGMLGMIINSIVFRTELSEIKTFYDALAEVKSTCFESLAYEDTPFGKVVEHVQPQRSLGLMPLTQYFFNFMNTPTRSLFLPGLELEVVNSHNRTAKFDIDQVVVLPFDKREVNEMIRRGHGIVIEWQYNSDIFNDATMNKMFDDYQNILEKMVANPFQSIDLINSHEAKEIIHTEFSETTLNGAHNLIDLFHTQVATTPDNLAIVFNGRSLTYLEVDKITNCFARFLLQEYDLSNGNLVGIVLGRSEWSVISMISILKAGASFLPIDLALPSARKRLIIEDAGLALLVTDTNHIFDLDFFEGSICAHDVEFDPKKYAYEKLNLEIDPCSTAYVIYTSGSTGIPKGVEVTHAGIANTILSQMQILGVDRVTSGLQFASFSFDASISETFIVLLSGSALYVIGEAERKETKLFEAYMDENQIELATLPPSFLNLVNHERLKHLKILLTAGESPALNTVKKYLGKMDYFNAYGPTETSICATMYKIHKGSDWSATTIPIGKPIANTRIYVLNSENAPVQDGIVGEICVSGVGLAKGYLNRPELTAKRFVTHPFIKDEKLYKTGDLGRWLKDGNLEFIGRKDQQVKIRGHRLELGEVEHTIRRVENVHDAVVLVNEVETGDRELVAYIIGAVNMDVKEIRASLSNSLPDYMVPSHFICLDEFPLNANGKIDKKRLLSSKTENSLQDYVPPRNELEFQVHEIWSRFLNRERIGIKDDFFELGGHSLKATRFISEYHKVFGVSLELKDLFDHTTLESHAELISTFKKSDFVSIKPIEKSDNYAISDAQRRLWVLCQFAKASIAYNMPGSISLEGKYDLDSFKKAFSAVIERHEILRTVFKENNLGEVRQWVLKTSDAGFNIEIVDFSSEKGGKDLAKKYIAEDSRKAFDLEKGPLMRAALIQLEKEKYQFYLNIHHLIGDGWSMEILSRDVLKFYEAFKANVSPEMEDLTIQYKDYSAWQLSQLDGENYKRHQSYWLDQLSGNIPTLDLPSNLKRPGVLTYNGNTLATFLDKGISHKLRVYSGQQDGTLFMGLVASVKGLLYRYTSQGDIIVGTPIAGRGHADLENQIGFYVNTLVLRDQVKGSDSFDDIFSKVRTTTLNAYAHQIYPFSRLVDDSNIRRDISRSAFFDVNIALQNVSNNDDEPELSKEEINVITDRGFETSIFDIVFTFKETGKYLSFTVRYNTDVYERSMIEGLMIHYKRFLANLLDDTAQKISAIDFLTENEKELLTGQAGQAVIDYPAENFIELFTQQVSRSQNTIALIDAKEKLTYKELDNRSNQLANFIRGLNLKAGSLIGILMDNSANYIVSMLAAIKAGVGYVPFDPSNPTDRLRHIMNDARLSFLITEKAHLGAVNKLQWDCDKMDHYLCMDSADVYDEKEDFNELMDEGLWDYVADNSDNLISGGGWVSSYTGLNLSEAEMREYAENVFSKVEPFLTKSCRVLEIGCSSGITMFGLADRVQYYHGTDLSAKILENTAQEVKRRGLKNIKLSQKIAHEIETIEDGEFDLIIINSVVQSFSGYNYLRGVLKKCINQLSDTGVIFLGDLQDQDLKHELLKSLFEFKSRNDNPAHRTKTDWDSELFVSKRYLEDLMHDMNSISEVQHSLKTGLIKNELSQYRFDALLKIDKKNARPGSDTKRYKFQYDKRHFQSMPVQFLDKSHKARVAYAVYTSGSTGHAKGVEVGWDALLNYCHYVNNEYYRGNSGYDIGLVTSLSFDLSLTTVFPTLMRGDRLNIFDLKDANELLNQAFGGELKTLKITPSHVRVLEHMNLSETKVEICVIGGEILASSHVEVLRKLNPGMTIINEYGPTETTVGVSVYKIVNSNPVLYQNIPIGKPISNVQMYVVNEADQLQPIGVPGEILIGGTCLANGYLNRSELTHEKFIDNPFKEGSKLYKTGDVGYWLPDGNLQFIGRSDDQVKIRGYRIELGEIEAELNKLQEVNHAIVQVITSETGEKELVAYYIGAVNMDVKEIRASLSNSLPDYMVPSHFICVDKFPLNANGKIDKKALPSPRGIEIAASTQYVAPANEIEEQLVRIWEEVLKRDTIGTKDDFFELGGHSLKATNVISKIQKEFGVQLKIENVFEKRTVESIAPEISRKLWAKDGLGNDDNLRREETIL